jgi:signal peptidase I
MNESLIPRALAAWRQNQVELARDLLRLQVKYYPDIIAGWHWLARVTDQPAEGIECQAQLSRITAAQALPDAEIPAPRAKPRLRSLSGDPIPRTPPPTVAPLAIWVEQWVRAANGLMRRLDLFVAATSSAIKLPGQKERLLLFSKTCLDRVKRPQTARSLMNGAGYLAAILLVAVLASVVVPVVMGNRALVIISGSMVPAIRIGSVVILRPVPSTGLNVGDVIAYTPPGGSIPVVHRIIRIREAQGTRFYTTQGDANPGADTVEVALPPRAWQASYSVPVVGYLIGFAFSPLGFELLVVVPLLGLGALKIRDWLRRPPRTAPGQFHIQIT